MAVYKTAVKTRQESIPQEVALPDGRTVYKVGNQMIDPMDSQKKALDLQKTLEEQDKTAQQEGEKKVFLGQLNEYRGWIKSGGIVGPGAEIRQKIDSVVNPDAYAKRWKLNQVVSEAVLSNIKKLGANPTEGERKFILDMQPKITDPAPVWDEYFNTVEGLVGRQVAAEQKSKTPAQIQSAQTPVEAKPSYTSADAVKADFKAGRISREQAMQALGGFGMK